MSDTMSDMGALSRLRADAIGDQSRYCELIAKVSMMLEMLKQQAEHEHGFPESPCFSAGSSQPTTPSSDW